MVRDTLKSSNIIISTEGITLDKTFKNKLRPGTNNFDNFPTWFPNVSWHFLYMPLYNSQNLDQSLITDLCIASQFMDKNTTDP